MIVVTSNIISQIGSESTIVANTHTQLIVSHIYLDLSALKQYFNKLVVCREIYNTTVKQYLSNTYLLK